MGEIYIFTNGQQLGPFDEQEVRQDLDAGRIAAADLAWAPGRSGWLPLGEFLNISTIPPPLPEAPPVHQIDSHYREDQREEAPGKPAVAIWNPVPAALWSLVFSPLLGSILFAKNWRSLGQPARARHGWIHVIVLVGVLLSAGFVFGDHIPPMAIVAVYAVWFFASALPQIRFVQETLPAGYAKKKWREPLLVALFFSVLFASWQAWEATRPIRARADIRNQSRSDEEIVANHEFATSAISELLAPSVFEVHCQWKERGGFLWLNQVPHGSRGSAVMLYNTDDAAVLITNRHVIEAPTAAREFSCWVRGANLTQFVEAGITNKGKGNIDLALLSVPMNKGAQPFRQRFREMAGVQVGESCVAIGNALSKGISVTAGIVSRVENIDGLQVIRISAPINHGNSGGALFANKGGALIGIVSSGINGGKAQNIGWAIPIDYAFDEKNWEAAK